MSGPTNSSPWSLPWKNVMLGQHGSPKPRPNQPRIRLVGDGPCLASASSAIERQPFCWDSNGFYRRLGLPPGAPRIEVARAFLELDGHSSSAMTNAVRVLVDREAKARYDALPLGMLWADDELLTQGLIEGDFEPAIPQSDQWAVYVDGIDPAFIDHAELNTWRWMIAYLLWRSNSPVKQFAMGVSTEPCAALVGFRYVAFVTLDFKPAWEYVSEIALGLQKVQSS